MIVIRVESDDCVVVFDDETAVDADDCLEIKTELFDVVTIADCVNAFKKFKKSA